MLPVCVLLGGGGGGGGTAKFPLSSQDTQEFCLYSHSPCHRNIWGEMEEGDAHCSL